MQVLLSVRCPDGLERHIELRARPEVTVAQLNERLAAALAAPALRLRLGGAPLPEQLTVASAGLRSGATVSCVADGERLSTAPSALALHVINGPDCGIRVPLTRREYSIGRSAAAHIRINDPDISRVHAGLRVGGAEVTIKDLNSTNGTLLEATVVQSAQMAVPIDALIRLGNSVLTLSANLEPPAATRSRPDGSVLVRRAPRWEYALPKEVVDFPADDDPAVGRPRTQWLATLLPAALGVALAASMHNAQFLAFALLSPVSIAATTFADRRSWRRGVKASKGQRGLAIKAARQRLAVLLAAETSRRRYRHPDACSVARTAATADCRLWERNRTDADFLSVRVGSADQPAHTEVSGRADGSFQPMVQFVPVLVSLRAGPLGIHGPEIYAQGVARWLVAQSLTAHSPNDVSVVALLHEQDSEGWRWLRWTHAQVSLTTAERESAVQDLAAVVSSRLLQHSPRDEPWTGPWTLVLIDPLASTVAMPELAMILREGSRVGVSAVCVANGRSMLPRECRSVLGFATASGTELVLSVEGEETVGAVACERVSSDWAETLGRDLAPLRDENQAGSPSIGPEVRLFDLLGLDAVSPEQLLTRWKRNNEPTTVIGSAVAGPVAINLISDGPHALIAGTTGSGKSELLRCLVAGLAANNCPATLNFVLIDYKGGAAFAACAELPHTVAVVTDLDSHLTERALVSLDAELKRRESAFAAAGVTDLSAYQATMRAGTDAIARLVLVVDEFAALAEELPNFISGLVGIAQRGRSLGVHLILATQRPGGVVSPEIKANMALRIALRVIDPAESSDVIGTSAAALITKASPGRGYAQLADGLVEFQTARVGLAVPPAADLTLTLLDEWNRKPEAVPHLEDKTDLDLLRDCAREAARSLGVHTSRPVWLPPLPTSLSIDLLAPDGDRPYAVAFGLSDVPSGQRQPKLAHDLQQGGSLAFIGGPRSGRSGALRSIAGIAARQLGGSQLSLQVIDCAGGSLLGLSQLDCCQSSLAAADFEAISRLLQRLDADLEHRLSVLTKQGFSSVQEAAERGVAFPVVLILIDGWEGFSALSDGIDSGRSVDLVLRLLRDGPAAGLTVVLAGDRSLLGVRVAAAVNVKLVLALTDPSDYAVAGISSRDIPSIRTPGRGVSAGEGVEFQLATLGADASKEWDAISAIALHSKTESRARNVPSEAAFGSPAPTVPADPFQPVSVTALPQKVLINEVAESGCVLGLGLGGDTASPISVDSILAPHSRFLIAGPARSGRSSTGRLLARQAVKAGISVLVAASVRSPMTAWARRAQVPLALVHDDALPASATDDAFGLIIVDDAELFTETTVGALIGQLMASTNVSVLATARAQDLLVSFRGLAVDIRREGIGLLLAPSATDGELLGITVPRRRGPAITGRGILVTDELRDAYPGGMPIQVAYDG